MRKANLVAVAFASIATAVASGAIGVIVTVTEASAQAPSAVGNEVMMEDAAAENLILGQIASPTSGQSLTYTSSVDPTTNAYSFSTTAGRTLNGQWVSLTGSGTETTSSTGFPTSLLTPCATYTVLLLEHHGRLQMGRGQLPLHGLRGGLL